MDVSPIRKMRTEINNRQRKFPLQLRALRRLFAHLADQVAQETPGIRWKEIILVLLDDAGMTAANEASFGKNNTTDVISLRYAPTPEDDGQTSGEVLVNVQRAQEEGTRRGDRDYELAFYIAHGCLHLTGADDASTAARAAMHRRQTIWLRAAPPDCPISLFDSK